MTGFPSGFLWGASTAPHQIEGNNLNSDWWASEGSMPGMERSGDACDSYHRYPEDISLLANAGLNTYRFGIEWARVEPERGSFSLALLDHYRRMIDTARDRDVTPVVTLHHFSSPLWFAKRGGWMGQNALDDWTRYVEAVTTILDDVPYVCTINEPSMLALMVLMMTRLADDNSASWKSPTVEGEGRLALPEPSPEISQRLIDAHTRAREMLHANTDAKVGWTLANQAFEAAPGGEETLKWVRWAREDIFLEAARGDDFIGVQAYSSQLVGANGPIPHPPHPDNTMIGTAYRPDALAMAVRHTAEVTGGVPILVTENGMATPDDTRRIAYTRSALEGLRAAIDDGIEVRGYLHWSLLDNYEWGHWGPTFGLISVDRETFTRTPKPSLAWLGSVAQRNGL